MDISDLADNGREQLLYDLLQGKSLSQVKLKEAIYDTDAQKLFEEIYEEQLGLAGMRLDLFIEYKSMKSDKTSRELHPWNVKQKDVILSDSVHK